MSPLVVVPTKSDSLSLVPERIMCPELTGSPVRGCSQEVLRVLSLQERHLLLSGNKTTKTRINNAS